MTEFCGMTRDEAAVAFHVYLKTLNAHATLNAGN